MNERLNQLKAFAKKHAPEIVGASIVVATATVTTLIVRHHYESKIAFVVSPQQMMKLRDCGGSIIYNVEGREFGLTIDPK